jgi:hypothetical protein
VVNVVPVSMRLPPVAASYHFTGSFEVASRSTVPGPHRCPAVVTGSAAALLTVATVAILALVQLPLVDSA